MIDYEMLNAAQAQQEHPALCEVLTACVAQGASVGFIDAADHLSIARFWQDVVYSLASGDKRLLVAREQGRIVGTIIVVLGMMPNGAHRAEISKLLVHPRARRQGIARQLMLQAEQIAVRAQRTLLVLDTRSGDVAEQLYRSLGWQAAGSIPHYARSTAGEFDATTLMYKLAGQDSE
ncbi:GNAT family N-acetyltransferase [Erwiniaceae bacterium BAC15a-03b]|uniref:GNAT family N-acetyltransferase n=1 Tax=Winslowiella arboricola TaxID=2978220 RepID=A0A9J6PVG8_9GAMM|nr:GNAT family N-acetyltransferase [Winslowiella arboricola]MCU5772926.1 GNAT family N-acetyltransferase [Winslowiella arboricola]MCU5780646.1 GNAT family N-acetyltransferase [Winslowiella arboricola]